MITFPGHTLIEQIDSTSRCSRYRARVDGQNRTVVIKVLHGARISPAEMARLRHEHALIRGLEIEGIIRPLDVIELDGCIALVMEDFDGVPLGRIIGDGLEIGAFLELASGLAEILSELHQHDITHRSIKPGNILIHRGKKRIGLTDFGIASEIAHLHDEIYNPWVIQEVLAYISPEQTGRMNCPVDYRSDLYSLGVTFYQMLTGRVPFISKDPMEIINAQIARSPIPPHPENPAVPPAVSGIVMKLLAKAPQERYQNSAGLLADLRECRHRLHSTGRIEPFTLASQDISTRFIIPQLLVGREAELAHLGSSLDRVSRGRAEVLLVSGEPGIGKSALIQELHKPIVARRGYFLAGKYEELRRYLPYSGIIQAFQALARHILSESEERIREWKQRIAAALGENARIITDAIPEMVPVVGEGPPIAVLGPEETRNRFNLVFKNFVRALCGQSHPVVIFLDDLQWADTASLNLIQTIACDPDLRYLLIIGAYRNSEVPAHHPLMLAMDSIRASGTPISTMSLGPLDPEDVCKLIATFLRNPEPVCQPLANLIHDKTKGNPFFVTQFLKTLYAERHIVLSPREGWTWDIRKVRNLKVTENVVEFLAGKLGELEPETRRIIEICACIGSRFDADTLVEIAGEPMDRVLTLLDLLITEGFIHRREDMYHFHHDRIQEAAYSLLSEEERTRLHHQIGLLRLKLALEGGLMDGIFTIADHLNKAHALITAREERIRLADLNLKAGLKARDSTAYQAAVRYLEAGIELLPEDAWQCEYTLTYTLHTMLMECQYLSRNFDEAQHTFEIIKEHAANRLDKARAYTIMVELYTTIRAPGDAIRLGLEGLTLFGWKLSQDMGKAPVTLELVKAMRRLRKTGLKGVLELGRMQDEELLVLHDLLRAIATPAFYASHNLFAFIVLKGVNDSIRYGHTPHSASAFMCLATIVGNVLGNYPLAFRIGETALQLNDILNNRRIYGLVLHIFAFFIQHWKKHARHDIEIHRRVFELCLASGDFIYAGHSITANAYCRLVIGHPLQDIMDELHTYSDFMAGLKDPFITSQYRSLLDTIASGSRTEGAGAGTDSRWEREKSLARLRRQGNLFGLGYLLFAEAMGLYLRGSYEEALAAIQELDSSIKVHLGTLLLHGHYYYYSLILTALLIQGKTDRKRAFMKIIRRNQRMLARWCRFCSVNFRHKHDLIEAELAVIEGRNSDAIRLYHAAIEGAHENEYPLEEAMACLRTAEFYLSRNCPQEAGTFLVMAHDIYRRIGMKAKAVQLEKLHPFLASGQSDGDAVQDGPEAAARRSASSMLDLATVMQASQAISSEIVLERLLKKLIHIFLTNAGAQRGALILEKDGKLFVEASKEAETGEVRALHSEPLDACKSLARSAVHYVHRTCQDLIVGDAREEGTFQHDPYVRDRECKSILCAPIMNKGQLTGIIYMENNLIPNAFTPERLELLRLISAQAAISIENARLFELATTDSLTRLFAHRYFQVLLDRQIRDFERFQRPFSLVMLDIDDFKQVNDSYGHLEGDRILKAVANCLKNNTRAVDLPARYGGDELVIILPETGTDQARAVAEKLRACVEELEIPLDGRRMSPTVSLGVATFPFHAQDRQGLIRCADAALYAAKRAGKNCVCVADPPPPR